MLKLFLTATITLLVTLATLTACSDPTPAPETLAPTSAPTPTVAPASTDTPVSTETPTEKPTAAPTATPASSPTHAPTPTPNGRIAPLQMQDSGAFRSALSDAELACIGENPERQTRFVGCLEDETLARVFLAGFVPSPEPLSESTSECVRAAFDVIDPRAVMTAGIEGDPGRAMAGSMAAFSVTTACLTDQEWEVTAPQVGMSPDERAGMQCLMAELGGPGNMAEAMLAAQEGDLTSMANAGAECGLDMGPMPPAPPAPTLATTLVITVAAIPAELPEYDRSDWRHWEDHDGDCQDARQEVLIGESLLPVTYKTDRECRVEAGRWYGAFTGDYFEDPGDVDVDHMVPLKNAHNSGGWDWNPAMKEEYANNLGDDDHLIAVQDNANQSKGARGPDEWKPRDETYWCQYATDWAEIKERWSLTMTEPEAGAVVEMLNTCEDPPVVEVEVWEALGAATGEHKPEPTDEPESSVYESCEEAAAAGEQRVQGSQGGGQGYPKRVVPSARDGDGDGIVCER